MLEIEDAPRWIGLHETPAIHRHGLVVDFEDAGPACLTESYILVADLGGGIYRYQR